MKILEDAKAADLPVGEVLYNSAMEACGAAGKKTLAISLLEVRKQTKNVEMTDPRPNG